MHRRRQNFRNNNSIDKRVIIHNTRKRCCYYIIILLHHVQDTLLRAKFDCWNLNTIALLRKNEIQFLCENGKKQWETYFDIKRALSNLRQCTYSDTKLAWPVQNRHRPQSLAAPQGRRSATSPTVAAHAANAAPAVSTSAGGASLAR